MHLILAVASHGIGASIYFLVLLIGILLSISALLTVQLKHRRANPKDESDYEMSSVMMRAVVIGLLCLATTLAILLILCICDPG